MGKMKVAAVELSKSIFRPFTKIGKLERHFPEIYLLLQDISKGRRG